MRYVALLRGINVGGKNKVEMARLKETFHDLGATDVKTYINSGNIVFSDPRKVSKLTEAIEDGIERDFGTRHPVVLRTRDQIQDTVAGIPDEWVNDSTMRTNVLFLWEQFDSPDLMETLPMREGIDEVIYLPGAVVWRNDAGDMTRSGLSRVTGTDLYKAVTIRNVNTVRKLAELLDETESR